MKRIPLAAAAFTLVMSSGCGGGGSTPGAATYGALRVALMTDKAVYARGEPVTATITATNTGSKALSMRIEGDLADPTLLPVSLDIARHQNEVWQLVGGAAGSPMGYTIAAGASVKVTEVWPQMDDGGQAVAPGQYTLTANISGTIYNAQNWPVYNDLNSNSVTITVQP